MSDPKKNPENRPYLRLVHSAPPDGTIFGAGSNIPPKLLVTPPDLMALLEKNAPRIMTPELMVAEISAYQKTKAVADMQFTEETGDQDWVSWFDSDFDTCEEMAEWVFSDPEEAFFDEIETWYSWLGDKLGNEADTVLGSLKETQFKSLELNRPGFGRGSNS